MTKKIWILIIKFYALAGQKIEKGIKVIDEFLAKYYNMQIRSTITVYNEYFFFFLTELLLLRL